MPWVQIDSENINRLSILGYDKVAEDDCFWWFATPHGRLAVEKADPRIYFEDVNDALQFNPRAVMVVSNNRN